MGRALKHAFIGTVLSGVVMGLLGCTSITPKVEPTPAPVEHRKVVRTTHAPKVIKRKKLVATKVVKPTEEAPVTLPVIRTMGGGNGGSSGGGGGGWGG